MEAAVKKMKIRKEHKMKEKAKKTQEDGWKVRFVDEESESEEESDVDSAEYFEDDDKEETKEMNEELEEPARVLKPAEGVKFVQYDEFGVPMEPDSETGFDYQKHIVKDDMQPGDFYIEAPPEMVARMTAKPGPGIRRDVDKDPAFMTEEERAVFQCLEDGEFVEADGYEELEDDFLMIANEGKPALVEAKEEFFNKDVVIVRDEEAEALAAMRQEIKRRF